jgi:hypothetical protein
VSAIAEARVELLAQADSISPALYLEGGGVSGPGCEGSYTDLREPDVCLREIECHSSEGKKKPTSGSFWEGSNSCGFLEGLKKTGKGFSTARMHPLSDSGYSQGHQIL